MNNSPSKKIWRRFKRNKLAFAGLIFISLMMLMAILGYLITPDQTPYASRINLALNKKKPGRTFQFLITNHYDKVKDVNFFEKMLFGQPAQFKSITSQKKQFFNLKTSVKHARLKPTCKPGQIISKRKTYTPKHFIWALIPMGEITSAG
jgi:predicted MPP superfamily phosphohydrolase